MAIVQENRTGLYYVTKDGKVLASFETVEEAKVFWEDYKKGQTKAPLSNDIEGSRMTPKKRFEALKLKGYNNLKGEDRKLYLRLKRKFKK